MNLRPHHLLCIQKYTGHGYDAVFTVHMNRLTASLQPDTVVKITYGTDDICAKCPNRIGDRCRSEEKVQRLDSAVSECCGITVGTVQPWQTLARTACDRILNTDAFSSICAECDWYGLCQNTEVQK